MCASRCTVSGIFLQASSRGSILYTLTSVVAMPQPAIMPCVGYISLVRAPFIANIRGAPYAARHNLMIGSGNSVLRARSSNNSLSILS